MKHKPKHNQIDLYLSDEDIERLNARYDVLYKQVKTSDSFSEDQINRACEILLKKYNFEIEELSAEREPEYWTRQAKIAAKNKEQIPWRRSWLWRLIFHPTTNRAQDIIEERAALEADARFTAEEKILNDQEDELYGDDVQLSQRKRKRLMKKYLKLKHILEGENADNASDDVHVDQEQQTAAAVNETPTDGATLEAPAHDDVHTEEPPEPPPTKSRSNKKPGK